MKNSVIFLLLALFIASREGAIDGLAEIDAGNSGEITLEAVPLSAPVATTPAAAGSGEKYHRPERYYNGKLCRTIQNSTLHEQKRQTAIDLGFEARKVCKPDSRIAVSK